MTYDLPKELIAQRPCEPRDQARLLLLDRASEAISHRLFRDLPQFLRSGDCLVLNDTKVRPARLYGKRADTGGKVELLLLRSEGDSIYRCLGQPGKRLKLGTRLIFNGTRYKNGSTFIKLDQNCTRYDLEAEVIAGNGAERVVQFNAEVEPMLSQMGQVPLPPYIRRAVQPEDRQWYQTVYARYPGAVAAPTAGLHFTEELLDQIRGCGVRVAFVTLHVGWGTFKPVGEEELKAGRLHPEWFRIPLETTEAIRATKQAGGRVVAVGTTVVRALETAYSVERLASRKCLNAIRYPLNATDGSTDLFIRPPFRFRVVDGMITNFHLPGTSLLYLVAAFAGKERVLAAYQEAIRQRYRFYSYGDAMLIL